MQTTLFNSQPVASGRHAVTAVTAVTFGYVRVSTTRQELSIEAQGEAISRAAEYHVGHAPDEIFTDPDTSGSLPFAERDGGRRLIQACRDASAPGGLPAVSVTVIVTKVDRLGRDTVDVSQTASLFDSLGVRLVLLDINVDTRTAMGRAFMQIAAFFAELERARIRERIQTTLDLKRSQNLVTGTVPYGWDDRPTGATGKTGKPVRELVPNPEEQKWILWMARARAAGTSLTQIANQLNRQGVPTKRRGEKLNLREGDRGSRVRTSSGLWNFGIVQKILNNKTVQAFLADYEP